jgi:hypothetical protein
MRSNGGQPSGYRRQTGVAPVFILKKQIHFLVGGGVEVAKLPFHT